MTIRNRAAEWFESNPWLVVIMLGTALLGVLHWWTSTGGW